MFGSNKFSDEKELYFLIKRIFDIIFSILGIIIMIPISIIIKILYVCSGDYDSIFYVQKRIGLYGREIKIYKYRTMIPGADNIIKELLKDEKNIKEWEKYQKLENDPRITKIGEFLRKSSIDEVPQFINVLKGDMSIVGPRPLVEGELEAHNGLKLYNQVKPGMTGWWACNGRSNIDYSERLEMEYYYIRRISLYLDVLCIIRTFIAVIKRTGSK